MEVLLYRLRVNSFYEESKAREKCSQKRSVPEILDVASNKKSAKQAMKNTISITVKNQKGGSCKRSLPRKKDAVRRERRKHPQQLQNVRVSF